MAWTRHALGLLVAAALGVACTFPDPTYRADGGAIPDDGPSPEASVDASGEGSPSADGASDGALDANPAGDAASGDAPSGDGPSGDANPDAPVCDQDLDTFRAKGGTCGGTDCCDIDNKANTAQKGYFVAPDNCGSFDYDCSGKAEPEYVANLACGGTGLTGCTGGSGYVGPDPGCGNSAVYGSCIPNGTLACKPGSFTNVQQACH
jgi:hypothetical protein